MRSSAGAPTGRESDLCMVADALVRVGAGGMTDAIVRSPARRRHPPGRPRSSEIGAESFPPSRELSTLAPPSVVVAMAQAAIVLERMRAVAASLAVRSQQVVGRLGGDRCLASQSDAVAQRPLRSRSGCPLQSTSETPGGSSGVTLAIKPVVPGAAVRGSGRERWGSMPSPPRSAARASWLQPGCRPPQSGNPGTWP